MYRTKLLFGLAIAGASVTYLMSISAEAQAPTAIPSVWLQPATPGTMQTGNANISGTMKAGQFMGGGAGITNVNADLLDGLNSTAFLQAVPNPLTRQKIITLGANDRRLRPCANAVRQPPVSLRLSAEAESPQNYNTLGYAFT